MKLKYFIATSLLIFFFFLPFFALADVNSNIQQVGQASGLPGGTVYEILINFMLWLLKVLTVLAVISFIIAGLMFVLSGSNKNLAETAKTAVGYSILGLAIALSGYIIISLIASLLFAQTTTTNNLGF